MGNFLGNLGAAFRGQQEYQTYLDKQEADKLRLKNEKLKQAEFEDQLEQAKQQRARQSSVDQTAFDFLSSFGGPGIPPPPPGAGAPPQQPPAPGQQSVPMVQPGQRPQGMPPPQGQMPPQGQQGMPPPPQGGMPPQGPPQGQPMPQGGPQTPPGGPQGQPPIPPYQTVGGSPQPQQPPQGIPAPPPQQQPGTPTPNSMTLKDAAAFIKAQGIKDPIVSMQVLEKLTPYLNNEAKQEATMLKIQLEQKNKDAELEQKKAALTEQTRMHDMASEDRKLSIEERRAAAAAANATRAQLGLINAEIHKMNAQTRATEAGGGNLKSKDGIPAPGVEAASWNYLLKNQNPPARGGMYAATMANIEEIAKQNNMSVQELTSASADVKTKLAAKRNFEIRAQNMERAENTLNLEIPVMEDAMKELKLSSLPDIAKADLWLLRKKGDPRVTKLDQAADTVFNEFQGIITGNPGTLNVSDVKKAQDDYDNAKTPETMAAAISGMRRIIGNAKKAVKQSRDDTMEDINASFKKPKPGEVSKPEAAGRTVAPTATKPQVYSNAAELQTAIKAGKIKKGDTFQDPSGASHTVN